MENGLIFGILIVAIAAVGAAAITTILDDIIQDVSAQIKKVPGQFPAEQTESGQNGQSGPEENF